MVNKAVKNNQFISYYDLLTLLKDNTHPKEIILHYNKDQKTTYKYDLDNGYIIKDFKRHFKGKEQQDIFSFYLIDNFLDIECFNKKIEILK